MLLTRIGSIGVRLSRSNLCLQRLPAKQSILKYSTTSSTSRKKDDDDDELDQPIKFSTSQAATWDARISRQGGLSTDKPWYQTWVVLGSMAVFMIYFFILREENDIDEKLTWQLTDHFKGESKENIMKSQRVFLEYQDRSISDK